VIAQLHYYLDDIDPRGIGKPYSRPFTPALSKELNMQRHL